MQVGATFPDRAGTIVVDQMLAIPKTIVARQIEILREFAALPPPARITRVFDEAHAGFFGVAIRTPEFDTGISAEEAQALRDKALFIGALEVVSPPTDRGNRVFMFSLPLSVFQQVFPNIQDISWEGLVQQTDKRPPSNSDRDAPTETTVLLTDDEASMLSDFLVDEARKLDPKYWRLLPFNPGAQPAHAPINMSSKVMTSFMRSYRIAILFHGAPDADNPLNNRKAERQLRKNGSPYIIHLLGIVWEALHVSNIRALPDLESAMMHDVPEDGVTNVQLLQPTLTDHQAMGQIRAEIISTFRRDADDRFLRLTWFIRGPLTYLQYIAKYNVASLNTVEIKLLDIANSLLDLDYLVEIGREDNARRQVGKVLRYHSELIMLPAFVDCASYNDTMLHLMKTLIRNSASIRWFEPYYERLHGSRRHMEDIVTVNGQILESIDRYLSWLAKPSMRDALSIYVADGTPGVAPELVELFVKRVNTLARNIRRGVSLPAAYVDPPSAKRHRLKLELRDASQSDKLDLIRLYQDVFPSQSKDTKRLRDFSTLVSALAVRQAEGFLIVAQLSGRIVGMLVGKKLSDPSDILLTYVGVRPDYRQKGIASSLFETVIEMYSHAPGIQTLTAHTSNNVVVKTYLLERLGFQAEPTGKHPLRWRYKYSKVTAAA